MSHPDSRHDYGEPSKGEPDAISKKRKMASKMGGSWRKETMGTFNRLGKAHDHMVKTAKRIGKKEIAF